MLESSGKSPMTGQKPRNGYKFSIRTLLVLMVAAGIGTCCFVLPDIVAARFCHHIKQQDFQAARNMVDDKIDMSFYWQQLKEQANEEHREISATWKRASFSDLIGFRREITVNSRTSEVGKMSTTVVFLASPTTVAVNARVP